jgi:hypothetical protein
VALVLILVGGAAPGHAQRASNSVQPHLRFDALLSSETAGHIAAGLTFRVSRYFRFDVAAGGGVGERPGGGTRGEGRGDVVARFVLDPEFSSRWGGYGGAGLSVRSGGGETRELLLIALGIEGPRRGGVVPFAELGLGGGVRLGVGVRRALSRRR